MSCLAVRCRPLAADFGVSSRCAQELRHQMLARSGRSRSSAQTAAPLTSGAASSISRSASSASAGVLEFPMAINTLRTKRARPIRFTGEPAKSLRKAPSSSRASSRRGGASKTARASSFACRPAWANLFHGQTARQSSQPKMRFPMSGRRSRGNGARVLDRQVGDAAAGVEPIGGREGVGRADVETGAAAPAMVGRGLIRPQHGGREDCAEKEPRAVVLADQIGVLALPAEARGFGERLFHHRRRVDEDLHAHVPIRAGARGELRRDALQRPFDQIVIVAVSRIDGDRAGLVSLQAWREGRSSGRNSCRA